MTRRNLVFLARGLISALLVGWLLTRFDLDELTSAFVSPHWPLLVAALAIYALSAFGGAVQWSWIMRASGLEIAGGEVRRAYFIGLFFNNFLPTNIGGDAYKIIDLGRREGRPLRVFCATFLDRLIGLSALTFLALCVAAVVTAAGIPLPRVVWALAAVLVLLLCVLGLLLSRRIGPHLPPWLHRLRLPGLARRTGRVVEEFQRYRARPGWLAAVFGLSLGVQALRIATHLVVAAGLGIALTGTQMAQLFVLIPLLAVSLTLPVTINGIGLRESVSVHLLTLAGLGEANAVAMEVAAYAVQVVFSLYGGLLFWLGRPR
jgi:uncharacterized protein (TIRG00374 family)